jgi:hypothetical protein
MRESWEKMLEFLKEKKKEYDDLTDTVISAIYRNPEMDEENQPMIDRELDRLADKSKEIYEGLRTIRELDC